MTGKHRYPEEMKAQVIEALVSGKTIRQVRMEMKKNGTKMIPDRMTIQKWAKKRNVTKIKQEVAERETKKIIKKELSRREREDRIISGMEYNYTEQLHKKKTKVKGHEIVEAWKYRRLRDGESTENIDNRIEFKITRLPPKDGNKSGTSPLPS